MKILLVALALLFAFSCTSVPTNKTQSVLTQRNLSKIEQQDLKAAKDLVRRYWLHGFTYDMSSIYTMNDLISKLDPHSNYMDSSQCATLKKYESSNNKGAGFSTYFKSDKICAVYDVEYNSSAWKAGLLIDDEIRVVNGVKCYGKSAIQVDSLVNRAKTYLRLIVKRNCNSEINYLDLYIPFDVIPDNDITKGVMLGDSIGYIEIKQFKNGTSQRFRNEVHRLKRLGMNKMILDLRDNGGGLLDEAQEVTDEFIPKGLLLYSKSGEYYTSDMKQEVIDKTGFYIPVDTVEYATNGGCFEEGEVLVLIDRNTASAAELLAGVLQQHQRARLMGEASFGKARIQHLFYLSGGGTLKLTIGEYILPNNVRIDKWILHDSVGLHPDIFFQNEKKALSDSLQDKIRKEVAALIGDAAEVRMNCTNEKFIPDTICKLYKQTGYMEYIITWKWLIWTTNYMTAWATESSLVNEAATILRTATTQPYYKSTTRK